MCKYSGRGFLSRALEWGPLWPNIWVENRHVLQLELPVSCRFFLNISPHWHPGIAETWGWAQVFGAREPRGGGSASWSYQCWTGVYSFIPTEMTTIWYGNSYFSMKHRMVEKLRMEVHEYARSNTCQEHKGKRDLPELRDCFRETGWSCRFQTDFEYWTRLWQLMRDISYEVCVELQVIQMGFEMS